MGCSGSKSTPVIESVTSNEAADKMIINSSIMKPAENIKDWTKDHVHDAGEDISGALKPSTPETERAADSEGSPAEKRSASPANKSEIAAVETDDGSARMTHNVEQLEKQLMDLDVPKGTKNYTQNAAQEMNVVEKPSTPMPEYSSEKQNSAVLMNAQWPNVSQDLKDKVTEETNEITLLEPIREGKEYTISPSDEITPTVIEILTIEIAEIPIAHDEKSRESPEGEERIPQTDDAEQ